MNDAARNAEILTREELDALLAGLADEHAGDLGGGSGSPFRAGPGSPAGEISHPALHRAVEGFARIQTRQLSNLYQARIGFRLMSWQEQTRLQIAETLLPTDRIATFICEPSGAMGFVFFGRPLLFALLCLNYGARPGSAQSTLPERGYTNIEERVYRRNAQEILEQLERAWAGVIETRSRVTSIDGASCLREEGHEKIVLATMDVGGLGDICRLRIGLPHAAFSSLAASEQRADPGQRVALESVVHEMSLELRVELGSAEMSLVELSELSPGTLIPVDSAEDGSLLVRVAGEPRFRGIRGTLGRKLAIQLTERF